MSFQSGRSAVTSLQAILETGFPEYLKTHSLPLYQWKAARALLRCRTASLGGHTQRCPEGHVEKVWYNSCRHRSCPQCSHLQIQQWLDAKKQQILPCDHFHVIFTLPAELRPLWPWNFQVLTDALFQAVRDTLFLLLEDPRHLGARPGMIAAWHTWGRSLVLHPHLHCLVTGGGLTAEGTWKSVRNGFLLPLAVVRVIFRGKLLSLVEGLIRRGELRLPPGLEPEISASQLVVERKGRCLPEGRKAGEAALSGADCEVFQGSATREARVPVGLWTLFSVRNRLTEYTTATPSARGSSTGSS